MTTQPKKKRGQPPHKPTDENHQKVRKYSALGIPQESIAKQLKICVETLHKYYDDDIFMGQIDANASVAGSLFNNATKNNNVTAQIFWLKSRAKWKEFDPRDEAEGNDNVITIINGLEI